MKLSDELVKLSAGLPVGKCYRTIGRHHEGLLYKFYRSLNHEERRIRFGGAVSDDAIARHCEEIDWRSTLVIVFGTALRLDAVAVNCRIDARRVENATVATKVGEQAVPKLLRLSAIATRDFFAAKYMLISLEGASWLIRHLREIGSVVTTEDFAEFDVTSIAHEFDAIDEDGWQIGSRAASSSRG
jgi:hypothetical protein